MSSYIVEDTTINRIISGLATASLGNEGFNSRFPHCPKELISDLLSVGQMTTLGQWMRGLNEAAVRERYEDADKEGMIPESFKYQSVSTPEPVQMLKSLQCFLYQCSEGDIPNMRLYTLLSDYINDLAIHIVTNLPEYNKARWA